MKRFPLSVISLALLTLATAPHAQQSSEVGKVTVTGEGDKLGNGLLIDEDTPKAKSTVTKAQIDKLIPSANPYQLMALLPGVNASSQDATGLFGGNLRVRGFNSDQMGFTINGAPVNDSGNFAVFPQEYSDSENLCEVFVTQGATDTEAPHVGASGGNVGITTCAPNDTRGGRASLTFGQLHFKRAFLRGDTGKIGNFKGFLSASKALVNKWRGAGSANREHVDAAAEYSLGNTKLSGSLLWNKAYTNNFRALSLAQLNTEGYFADYSTALPQHTTPVAGTRQAESFGTAYYGYSVNPFRNYLLTGRANIQVTPAMRVDVEPYYWYGYGTGGTQQTTVNEGLGTNRLHGGVPDVNGDGDTLDTVMIYRSSVTQTHRPGVTTKVSYTLDNQRILAGLWFERARHQQTGPGTTFDNAGNPANPWLSTDGALLKYADGTLFQGRNTITISTGESAFLQDTVDLMNSKLQLVPALSYRKIKRDFTNYGSSSANTAFTGPLNGRSEPDYALTRSYSEVLPSLGASFMVMPQTQVFASVSKNFRVPSNFEYFTLANGANVANGVGTFTGLAPLTVKEETSINVDTGLRYKTEFFKASVTAFYVKFKDRIASSFDPSTAGTHDFNVGDSTVKGLEVEIGTTVYRGFSAYASGSYTKSTIDNDLQTGATAFAPTGGKQFPDVPKGMAALSLQYAQGPLLVNLAGKFTGRRNITLVADQSIGGFTTIDLNAAYQLPGNDFFKKPTLRLNVANLGDRRYLLANSGSGSNIQITGAGNPQIYPGAPRFFSVSAQSDF